MKQNQKQKQKAGLSPSYFSKGKTISPEVRKRRLIFAFIVGVFGFLLYSNTLSHNYVLDDFSAIKENNIVRQGISAIPEIFETSYRQGYLSVKDGLYRPLSLATYAIEWNYFPDKPGVAHLINVILYGITGVLLFLMLCKFFGEGKGEATALIASLLFIVHPLHVEVVANIKSRDEILCFLFVLCSFLFVFRFLESGKRKFLGLAALTYFLSLLSKETSITFLALLPLSLHFFSYASIKKSISITALFIGVASIYLLIRSSVLKGAMADDGISLADNIIVGAKTFSTHMGTAFYILGSYVKLLFFPHPLSYDYSFDQIPIVSLGNIFSIISVLFYIVIGGYAMVVLYRSFQKNPEARVKIQEQKYYAFGILFFLITIFLFSNLVLIIGTSMGDRLMYFPSLGFCIVIAVLLVKLLRMTHLPELQIRSFFKPNFLPVIIILALYSVKTYSRNADWKDNYTLYAHDVGIVPNSVKAHYYLGLELVKVVADAEPDPQKKKSIYEEGIQELEKAIKILPTFSGAYTQMGVAYYRMKDYEKAIRNYNKASELQPSDAITQNNIGTVYFEWGKYAEATEKFQQAVRIDPRFVDANMNLGSVYGTIKDYKNAIASFQNAIHYAPDNARAYFFLAITYQNMGDKENADKYFQIAERMDPKLKRQ